MRSNVWVLFVVFLATTTYSTTINIPTESPLAFTENRGQWDDRVLFRASAGGVVVWFTQEGAYYQFTRRMAGDHVDPHDVGRRLAEDPPHNSESMAIRATYVDSNPTGRVHGQELLRHKCHYFIGNDPTQWFTDVPNYGAIVIRDVFSGIDLMYHGDGQQLKYDFIVAPGADVSSIRIRYDGASSVSVNAVGELVVETEWTTVTEAIPLAYQEEGDVRRGVSCEFLLLGDNTFGFRLGRDYDPTVPLVIDPVLIYSTYLGGSDHDYGLCVAADGSGAAYVSGYTRSSDFPALDSIGQQGGDTDAFVTKLSDYGSSLVYSTYLGGDGNDNVHGIEVGPSGSVYLTGSTGSTDFPTVNPFQTDQGSGDAYIARLNSSGSGLIYSTYLGGNDTDVGEGIAVDADGTAFVTGSTDSYDFPTANAYQANHNGGNGDAFVVRLDASGSSLLYSTYLGGSDQDHPEDIALDDSGHAYATGWTNSTDFPTANAFQENLAGSYDAFVTRFSVVGDSLEYSTYLGGDESDQSRSIALTNSGVAYVTGSTSSMDFPIVNPHQTDQGGGDVFVTALNIGGSIAYSTYIGGSNSETAYGISLDTSGAIYLAGETLSDDFPTVNAIQTTLLSLTDAFVAKLDRSGGAMLYSTYLGGTNGDRAQGIAVDDSGSAYVVGFTTSSDFPTVSPYQYDQPLTDVFIAKLSNGDADSDGIDDIADNCPSVENADQADGDADNVGDMCDNCLNVPNHDQTNNDSDDLGDLCDNCPTITNSDQTDTDFDEVGDACDNCLNEFNALQVDTDSDGLGDSCDNCVEVPNVGQGDGDSDAIGDHCDNCPEDANPSQEDSDLDSVGDSCDNCVAVSNSGQEDGDSDGVGDICDNCPTDHNTDQADSDGDTVGDECDECPGSDDLADVDGDNVADDCDNCMFVANADQTDTDTDGWGDSCDNCPGDYNIGQEDADGDGVGDFCDLCPGYDDNADSDEDGIPDSCDNCPTLYNITQNDIDGDQIGDPCDLCPYDSLNDIDADSVCGDVDNCPFVYNPDQTDSDENGIGDACQTCCEIVGDINHDGVGPDIADLVYLVNYMFNGGPPPVCQDLDGSYPEADADGSHSGPDIADLVYLVNYMFNGGPEPAGCEYTANIVNQSNTSEER